MIRSTIHNIKKGKANSSNAETMFVFALAVVIMIFLPLVLLVIQSAFPEGKDMRLPLAFNLSTIVTIAGSWVLYKTNALKQQDDHTKYKAGLLITLLLALIFLVLQWEGWSTLINDYKMQVSAVNFIIVLAVIHGIHLLIGIGLLIWLFIKTMRINTGSDFYILFLQPKHELGHRILHHYWHFISFLWVFLYIIMVLKAW